MPTHVTQTADGLTATWAEDFALNLDGYWIYGVRGPKMLELRGQSTELWMLGDRNGRKFGPYRESFEECDREIRDMVQQERECAEWDWVVGCEWRSDIIDHLPYADEEGGDHRLIVNGDQPGSAHREAKRLYDLLCREHGANGMCWYGRVDPETGDQKEEEACERDAADEEEFARESHERWLEDNHDAIVAQERYEMHRREY